MLDNKEAKEAKEAPEKELIRKFNKIHEARLRAGWEKCGGGWRKSVKCTKLHF